MRLRRNLSHVKRESTRSANMFCGVLQILTDAGRIHIGTGTTLLYMCASAKCKELITDVYMNLIQDLL
jgi:hypothetical protein